MCYGSCSVLCFQLALNVFTDPTTTTISTTPTTTTPTTTPTTPPSTGMLVQLLRLSSYYDWSRIMLLENTFKVLQIEVFMREQI